MLQRVLVPVLWICHRNLWWSQFWFVTHLQLLLLRESTSGSRSSTHFFIGPINSCRLS
ncbi:hypothetical protein INR49_010986, partial [Caranx melampygus]